MANLNFQYRSPALSLSFNESGSSAVVACGAAAVVVFGPGEGVPAAAIGASWFTFALVFALGLVTDSDGIAGGWGVESCVLEDGVGAPVAGGAT